MIFCIIKVRKGSESEEKGERTGHLKYNQSLLFPFVYASSSLFMPLPQRISLRDIQSPPGRDPWRERNLLLYNGFSVR